MNDWLKGVSILAGAGLLAVGCASPETADDDPPTEEEIVEEDEELEAEDEADEEDAEIGVVGLVAVAEVMTGDDEEMGTVEFTQTEEGVLVEGRLESLEPGPRGFHVHEHGECDPPDFESAGGHFNPTGHPHGSPEDMAGERHAGDFGNIEFDEDGIAEFSFVDEVITLGDGTNDIAGQALIVHYEEDDLESQPTGDAGPRAGCGLIETARDDDELEP